MEQPSPPVTSRPRRDRWREALVLASLLALAAVLRFGALGWGLRHEPHIDERYFVENVGWMLAHRDLDHRFDEYPGLVFHLLTPVLAWFDPPRFGAEAYLAARAVIAAFGVASVGLVYVLGARLAGAATGLVAALLLAVSPTEVQTAHMVRPDVVLEAFALASLLVRGLGAVAVALAIAGVGLARREWRRWLPVWVFPVTVVAVFATAEVHHARFVVPVLGCVALCAGEAARRLGGRWAGAIALAAAVAPLDSSFDYVMGIRQPSTRDLLLDRIDATVPSGGTVVTAVTDLGVPRERYRVLPTVGLDEGRARLLAEHADVVAAQPVADESLLRGLRIREIVEPPNRHSGPTLVLAAPVQPARYEPVDLRTAVVTASEAPERVAALTDGDPETWWATAGPQGGNWLDVSLPRAVRLGRVELRVPGRGRLYGRNIHLLVGDADGPLTRVAVVSGLPPIEPGARAGARQLLIFAPVVASRLRLVQIAEAARPWGVAELRIDRRVDESPGAEVITSADP